MLLAAETNDVKTVRVVEAPKSKPGDQVYVEGIGTGKKTVKFDEFMKVSIYVQENKVLYKGSQLQTAAQSAKRTGGPMGKRAKSAARQSQAGPTASMT